jgi:hypothetical protein
MTDVTVCCFSCIFSSFRCGTILSCGASVYLYLYGYSTAHGERERELVVRVVGM